MGKVFFELRYYLIILIIFIFVFLSLVFFPNFSFVSNSADYEILEVTREKIEVKNSDFSLGSDINSIQIFEIKKNDTLLNLLKQSGLKDSFIRALIKTKGSEKLARIKIGDSLEISKKISGEPKEIFLTSNGFEGVLAKFENNIFTIKRFSRPLEKLERFASVIIENSLYESALNEGLSDSLIMDLVYIFGWDIDFIFDIRPGDKFDV